MLNAAKLVEMLSVDEGTVKYAAFTYRSKGTGELAKLVVALGHNTADLYKMDLEILDALKGNIDGDMEPVRFEACCKLIESRNESLTVGIGNNSAYTHKDTYVYPVGLKGFRIHKESGEVYVSGLVHNKVTVEEGVFKVVKSRPLTLAKKEISKSLPSDKYRQYTLKNIVKVTVNGDTLEIETA